MEMLVNHAINQLFIFAEESVTGRDRVGVKGNVTGGNVFCGRYGRIKSIPVI